MAIQDDAASSDGEDGLDGAQSFQAIVAGDVVVGDKTNARPADGSQEHATRFCGGNKGRG